MNCIYMQDCNCSFICRWFTDWFWVDVTMFPYEFLLIIFLNWSNCVVSVYWVTNYVDFKFFGYNWQLNTGFEIVFFITSHVEVDILVPYCLHYIFFSKYFILWKDIYHFSFKHIVFCGNCSCLRHNHLYFPYDLQCRKHKEIKHKTSWIIDKVL